jgi:hypothetical protein
MTFLLVLDSVIPHMHLNDEKPELIDEWNLIPEVWDAVTGKPSPLAVWKKQGSMVERDLALDSGGSCFLVMVPGNGTAPVQEMMRKKTQIIIRRAIYRAVGAPDGKDVTGVVLKHLAASGSAGFPSQSQSTERRFMTLM